VVRVTTSSGAIRVVGEDRPDVVVERGRATETDGEVAVEGSSKSAVVRCPVGTDVVAGTSSGSIHLDGRLGEVRVTTSSGSIEIESAAGADVRSSSGRIVVGSCAGTCRVATSSGRIEVGTAGAVEVRTTSGKVDVGATAAQVRTVSSTVTIRAGHGDVAVESVSGKVTVTLPPGRHPAIDARTSKRPRIEVEPGVDGKVRAAMVSGRLTIASA
jgi:DUF4097 and DUF4098 domain-containing protein YvlB